MSFYNYRTERDLINGSDRRNRNPWFVKGGSETVYTPVDELTLGQYEYFQQHKTLSNGIVFYYECNDGGSAQYEVFDSVGKIYGEVIKVGGGSALPTSSFYNLTGPIRGCWYFSKAQENYRCQFQNDDFASLDSLHPWSIAFWYLSGATDTTHTILSRKVATGITENLECWGGTIADHMGLTITSGAGAKKQVITEINDNNFHRFVFTYNGGNLLGSDLKVYVDGVYSDDATGNYAIFDGDFAADDLFFNGSNGGNYGTFGMSQVIIWNRELSSDEVAVDYNSGDGLLWSPQIFDLNPSSVLRHEADYGNFQTSEDRGKHTEMVVAKFNSFRKTERGFLDKDSLSVSQNNALPWRNLEERSALTAATPSQPSTVPSSDSGVSWLNRTIAH